jgi:hypothetical protein
MPTPKLVVTGLSLAGLLSLTSALAQPNEMDSRPLDPKATTLRLLLGVGDSQVQDWSGRLKVDKGQVLGVEGWRFRAGDLAGVSSWSARSHVIRKAAPKKAAAKKAIMAQGKTTGPSTFGPSITPNGVIVELNAAEDATLAVDTERGRFDLPLSALADGSPHRYLDGKVVAQRIAQVTTLAASPDQEDFPSAAADRQGGVWVTCVVHKPRGTETSEALRERPGSFAYLVPSGGGDQIRLLRFANGKPGEALNVTDPGLDIWRPAAAVAGDGSVVVAWSEIKDGNWDLYCRRYNPNDNAWSKIRRLTDNPGTDTDAVLASAPDGQVWMAWQAWVANEPAESPVKNGQADIRLAPLDGPENGNSDIIRTFTSIDTSAANEWAPSIAIDRKGCVYVAYDTYQNGSYDVRLFVLPKGGRTGELIKVASTARFEARPSVAIDARGRAWVAYEERDAHWGKDAENLVEGKGSSLYRSSAVRVRCVDGGHVYDAPDPLASAPDSLKSFNSGPRLLADQAGRLWLMFRHRQEAVWGNNTVMVVGGVWTGHATSLAGNEWSPPQPLSRSDGLLDNRPALVQAKDGPVLAFYSTDGRLRREVEFSPELGRRYYSHSGTPPGVYNNDLMASALVPLKESVAIDPAVLGAAAEANAEPSVHPNEVADVERMRGYRIEAGGKTYQLLRGEFHRHCEISQDGGSDGSLEDLWRYAIDAGRLDWIGNGDHDNGGGKEYTWWLIQKTTDLYHNGPAFTPMFTYERSVAYPGGHRNVMFPRRGVRTLPRLIDDTGVRSDVKGVDEDAAMLYAYLNELGGICAAHTTGTGMGTDWRANDPKAEPFVEIFQGHRNSYEHLGAPRVARRPGEAIGGWKPLGMIWNALALQYRLGFQASSDHISTHISYAVAIAEQPTREAIFDAFRRRHCYGATDNILLDVRSGDHLMGDEFDADGPVRLKVLAIGTRPIKKLDIIKDFVYVYSSEPQRERVEFSWTDEEKRPPGLSWYYVRVVQDDGEIAWGSPMWVHHRPAGTGE